MPKIVEVTAKELFERNPEIREDDIKTLRDWLEKQPHLPFINDVMLIQFLHSCYYRVEPTKQVIDTFYTVRTKWLDLFCDRSLKHHSNMRKVLDMTVYHKSEGLTKEGYYVFTIALLDHDPSHYIFQDQIKLANMMVDIWLKQYGTSQGNAIIIDMTGFGLSHLPKLNLVILKKAFIYLQEALPFRLKAIHYVNPPPFIDTVMNILKPFTKKELLELIHIHPNLESLYTKVPKSMLLSNLGGEAESYEEAHKAMKELLKDNDDWWDFDEINNRVNESKRIGKPNNVQEMFGVDGSFKKLDLD